MKGVPLRRHESHSGDAHTAVPPEVADHFTRCKRISDESDVTQFERVKDGRRIISERIVVIANTWIR
jgi:hypothetical protein